ncbi:MarR family winged helix-turn-helix transcriptional regulator [Oceanobacter mangrovi]|uniref:MarR family winged helix-turn-helix transcriptional regulator n=1 Tax=Oceanobacter mangrovi TaxID=2862510 RepID=UPI001C8E1BDE|nr:MarR family transcriptional regulator [Oceanobacter mangrovi]
MENDDPTRYLGILIHEVARLYRRDFEVRAQDLGLTIAQWRALSYLSRNEGMNQVALADVLEIKPITLARQLDKMEQAGWVERRRDPADRRVSRLYLTPASQPLLDEMASRGAETRQQALGGLTNAEQLQIVSLLQDLKTNLLKPQLKNTDGAANPVRSHQDKNNHE